MYAGRVILNAFKDVLQGIRALFLTGLLKVSLIYIYDFVCLLLECPLHAMFNPYLANVERFFLFCLEFFYSENLSKLCTI